MHSDTTAASISAARVRAALEHTLLRADATTAMIDVLCEQARACGFAAVCVNPIYVARCRAALPAAGPRVAAVVGFPLGASHARCKALECELAIVDGADEIDMVMRIGAAKEGRWDEVERDAAAVVAAARGKPVKLIIETGLLDASERARACDAALASGIAYVKTCSGYAPGAATVQDVAALAARLAGRAAIKASGGIRSAAQARALLAAGAARLGTSAGLQIVAELDAEG